MGNRWIVADKAIVCLSNGKMVENPKIPSRNTGTTIVELIIIPSKLLE